MFYVYVLFSEKDRKLYIGSTPDLRRRFQKHKDGYIRSTKNRRPLKLIYYEAYLLEEDSDRREKYLKGGAGHKDLHKQLESVFKELNYRSQKPHPA